MFKKQLIVVLLFGLICTALIGYSVLNVSNSSATFSESGYVHVSAADNSNKRILFNSGTAYKKKVGDTVSFSDSLGEQSKVDLKNFIHYDDSSLSSFVDGVLVDLDELSFNTAIDHYALPSNTLLTQSGSSYSVLDAAKNFSFKNFIWKIAEDKYIVVSPNMKLRIGEDDERSISKYAEISYIGDTLIQVQTEDNIWQTISDDCHLFVENGLDLDLSNRTIQDNTVEAEENKVLLDFSRIVLNSEGNVELSPIVDNGNGETIIPHFDITAEDGAEGINGTVGTNGAAGSSGTDGMAGVTGGDGEEGVKGPDSTPTGDDIKDFPVFTIYDWNITSTSLSGKVLVTEKNDPLLDDTGNPTGEFEKSMLSYENSEINVENYHGKAYIQDLTAGTNPVEVTVTGGNGDTITAKAYSMVQAQAQGNDPDPFNISYSGLLPDHSYLLVVTAATSFDGGVTIYERPYISKTFWTDSLGVYGERAISTESTMGFNIINPSSINPDPDHPLIKVGCAVFDSYAEASNAIVEGSNIHLVGGENGDQYVAGIAPMVYPFADDGGDTTIESNTARYVRIAYDLDGNGVFDAFTSQILEISTLKKKASVSAPTLSTNQAISGFNVEPGPLVDQDQSFISYTYEFYPYNEDASGNVSIDTSADPAAKVITTNVGVLSVSIGTGLARNIKYCVRTIGTFNDNEKTYTIASDFSNPAMLLPINKPQMFFKTTAGMSSDTETVEGIYVTVHPYDNIEGTLVIQPSDSGAYLGLYDGVTDGVKSPHLVVKKDGYYYAEYPVYLSIPNGENEHIVINPTEGNKYLVANYVDSVNHTVNIRLGNTLESLKSMYSDLYDVNSNYEVPLGGMQPNSTYELLLYGDIVDATGVVQSYTQIGRCEITTGSPTTILAEFGDVDSSIGSPLKDASVRLSAFNVNPATDVGKIKEYNYEREAVRETTTEDGEKVAVPGTIKTITIDLFDGIIEESELEKDDWIYDPRDPSTPIQGYPTPLARRILDADNSEDLKIMDKLFNGVVKADGSIENYQFTPSFFYPSVDSTAADSYLANKDSFTIYIKEMTDYAYDAFQVKMGEYGVQKRYESFAASDKFENQDNHKYYYKNVFRADDPSTDNEEKTTLLVNKFNFKGTIRRACYITSKATIDRIKPSVFRELEYKNNKYSMTADYSNVFKTAHSVTYYVYDAVDFYYNTKMTANGNDTYTYYAPYNASSGGKIYPVNTDIKDWAADATDPEDLSKAMKYVTPVHLDGLELAKVTIELEYPEEGETATGSTVDVPGATFVPMTKQEYANEKYGGDPNSVPVKDPKTNKTLFFFDSIDHFSDDTLNAQLYNEKGHQYVFCWTVNVIIPETGVHKVFPFDSFVVTDKDTSINPDIELPPIDALDIQNVPYDYFAENLKDKRLENDYAFTGSSYLIDNPNIKFGKDAYILIPHTTISDINYALDKYKNKPKVESLVWESTTPNSGIPSITFRAKIYDKDEAVFKDPKDHDYVKLWNFESNQKNGYKTNLTSASKMTTSPGEPSNNVGDEINKLVRKLTDVAEVKAIRNSFSSDAARVVACIQRYNDKYTFNGKGLHKEDSTKDEYITSSEDGNWLMLNSMNKEAIQAYAELGTSKYTTGEKDNEYSLNGQSRNNINAYYFWNEGAAGIDGGRIAVDLPKNMLEKIAGFRFHFTLATGETFYVDKFLSTLDTYTKEGVKDVTQYEEIQGTNNVRVRFQVSLPMELLGSNFKPEDNIRVTTSNSIVHHGHPSLNGATDVKVGFELLYPSADSGYKYLEKTLYRSQSGENYYSDETFALKHLSKLYDENNVWPMYISESYYAFNTKNFSDLGPHSTAGYSSGLSGFGELGSFFHLRISGNSLSVQSTRFWSVQNANRVLANKSLMVLPKGNGNSYPMTDLLPILLKTTTLGVRESSGYINVNTYDGTQIPFVDDPPEPRSGEHESTIDMPGTDPYVKYRDYTEEEYKEVDEYSVGTYIDYTAFEPNEIVYLSVVKPFESLSENYFAANVPLRFYPLTGSGSSYSIDSENTSTSINLNLDSRYSDSDVFNSDSKYNDMLPYLCPVKIGDHLHDTQYYQKLLIDNCKPNGTKYTIIVWRYVYVQSMGKYMLKPADMFNEESIRINNQGTLITRFIPELSNVTVGYGFEGDDRYLYYSNFKFKEGSGDKHYKFVDPTTHYAVIELRESDDTNNFITYLYCGAIKESGRFDLDGVGDNDLLRDNGLFIYKHGISDFNTSSHKLGNTSVLCDDIKYGVPYDVCFRVYENGKGPAYVPNYDHAVDPDSIFVDKTTIGSESIVNRTPKASVLVTPTVDRINSFIVNSKVLFDNPSYYTFTVGSLSINSSTTRNQKLLPVAIWEHKEGEAIEYYDVSRYLTDGEGNRITGFIDPNSTLKLEYTEEADDSTPEVKNFSHIFNANENIHVYLFARQLGHISSIDNDVVKGSTLSDEVYFNKQSKNSHTSININDVLGALRLNFTPNYQDPASFNDGPKHFKITSQQFNRLNALAMSDMDNNFDSRLIRKEVVVCVDAGVSVGTVSTSIVKPFGEGANPDYFVSFEFSRYHLIQNVKKINYTVIAHTIYTDTDGSYKVDQYPIPIDEDKLSDQSNYFNNAFQGSSGGKISVILDIEDCVEQANAKIAQSSGSKNEEVVAMYEITVDFKYSTGGDESADLPASFNEDSGSIEGQTLSNNKQKLTTQIFVNEELKSRYNGIAGSDSSPNLFSSIRDASNNLLNALFAKDGGNNE